MPAPAGGVATHTLASTEFLRHYDKLLRPALDVWARELLLEWQELDAASAAAPAELDAVSAWMNKAGFVVAATGGLETALYMCERQLAWVARRHRACAAPGILGHAIQPWINMGRLHALRGDRQRALAHFRLAEHLSQQKPVTLGPCSLPPNAWPAVLAAMPDVPQVLWNTYALETVKASLRADGGAGALTTIARLRRIVPPRWHAFLTEGQILGLLHQGSAELAVARATAADPTSTYDEAAFGLHETTGLILLGHTERARHRATGLLAFLAHTRPRPRSKDAPTLLRQLRHLALLLTALNEPRYALAAALRGLDICADHDDQPLRLGFLTTALELAPGQRAAAEWERDLHHLRHHSLYAEIHRGSGTAARWDQPPFTDLVRAAETAATSGER
ncbi:hypothetical protein [Streptomyces sp. NPDC001205]